MYGDHYTSEQVEAFYEFTRGEMLDGLEYDNLKPIHTPGSKNPVELQK